MALNADAIPTSEQVRETLLDRFYYPYQKQIWAVGIALAITIVAVLAMREYEQRRTDDQWTRYYAALQAGDTTTGGPEEDVRRRVADARIALLKRLVTDYPDAPVTPYALHAIVNTNVAAGRYDDALVVLRDLRSRFKNYPLNTESADAGSSGQARSLADRAEAQINDERDWVAKTTYVHPKPSTGAMALVETTAGSFWMGFYDEQAPEHVANFKKLAKSGYFNGTQIYHVRMGGTPELPTPMLFEGGSAASSYKAPDGVRDPGLHERDEPDAVIEPEDSRFLVRHMRGVVSAVTLASGESARRFMVVAAEKGLSRYDGQNTPFAMVVDREGSFASVDRICRTPTYGSDESLRSDPEVFRMRDHPYPPVWIRRVTIWKDEKLEDGHEWDTARRSSNDPEPWEKDLPAPPKPSEFAPAKDPKPPVEPPK